MEATLSNEETILTITKSKLGIMSDKRDAYLKLLIKGLMEELQAIHGLQLDFSLTAFQMFISDYAVFRYENKGEAGMPRQLQWRLHNLVIRNKKVTDHAEDMG